MKLTLKNGLKNRFFAPERLPALPVQNLTLPASVNFKL
jgi:hypothetical protein